MKHLTIFILSFFSLIVVTFGQSIQEIFKSLPTEYTPELSDKAKNILLEKKSYTIPGGDSIETMKVCCFYEKDYLRLKYNFTTGQNGFIVIELRKFQKKDNSVIVVYSKFGGSAYAYDQDTLLTFDYVNGTLIPNENLGLPKIIKTKDFLKNNLPDSLKNKNILFCTSYNLKPNENNCIEYEINPQTDEFNKWIKTKFFLFKWNGQNFEPIKK